MSVWVVQLCIYPDVQEVNSWLWMGGKLQDRRSTTAVTQPAGTIWTLNLLLLSCPTQAEAHFILKRWNTIKTRHMLMGKFGTPGKRCNSFLQKICIKGLQNFALVKENKRLFLEGVLWFPTLHETGMVLDFACGKRTQTKFHLSYSRDEVLREQERLCFY